MLYKIGKKFHTNANKINDNNNNNNIDNNDKQASTHYSANKVHVYMQH